MTHQQIYLAFLSPEEEGGYTIIFPDLPGCISCADTVVEAMQEAQDALDTWFDGDDADLNVKPSWNGIRSTLPEDYHALKFGTVIAAKRPDREVRKRYNFTLRPSVVERARSVATGGNLSAFIEHAIVAEMQNAR